MTEDPEVYYSCGYCVLSFVKEASNGVYIETTTDHARCAKGCQSMAIFVCRVYPVEPVSDLKEELEESCPNCRYMTVTENTLLKARKAIMQVFPYEDIADKVLNELLNAGLLIRERI